jgi:hypothetical protein
MMALLTLLFIRTKTVRVASAWRVENKERSSRFLMSVDELGLNGESIGEIGTLQHFGLILDLSAIVNHISL